MADDINMMIYTAKTDANTPQTDIPGSYGYHGSYGYQIEIACTETIMVQSRPGWNHYI